MGVQDQEGEIAQYLVAGFSPQMWQFSVRDKSVAAQLDRAVGHRRAAALHGTPGVPTLLRRDTRFSRDRVIVTDGEPGAQFPSPSAVRLPPSPTFAPGRLRRPRRRPRLEACALGKFSHRACHCSVDAHRRSQRKEPSSPVTAGACPVRGGLEKNASISARSASPVHSWFPRWPLRIPSALIPAPLRITVSTFLL